MVLFGDYHTHTTYSDGKGSILESALMAKQKGLREIAITDHGFNKYNGAKRKYIDKMRKECELAEEKTGVKIYLGVEANIISKDGDLDLSDDDIKKLDIIVAGFHQLVKANRISDRLGFVVPNNLKISTNKRKEINTEAVIKALERYPIDILSHPGVGCSIDFLKVAKKANEVNTKLELNGKRIAYKSEDIKELIDLNTEFILSSDAHSSKRIGECNKGINFAIKNNIPKELICNLGKRPNFRKCKGA